QHACWPVEPQHSKTNRFRLACFRELPRKRDATFVGHATAESRHLHSWKLLGRPVRAYRCRSVFEHRKSRRATPVDACESGEFVGDWDNKPKSIRGAMQAKRVCSCQFGGPKKKV